MEASPSEEDEITVMLATDIHLGVNEKDGLRADDSFIAFEEILKISKEKDVDFILLGGDLFHDNKPSPQCLHKCLALLRKYCMGDKPIHVEFLSDQRTVFKNCVFPTVNYEDPNFNISIPVFSIHGNHDDPSGFGRMSALDLLSVSGFVNYFGKWTDLNKVKVYPLMLKKGLSKLAIYGLSHIKDERLYRLMKHNEVEYVTPGKDADSFFKLMVLHQNRVDRPGTNHIPESLIPSFIDLVFWGHEHDCRVRPEWNQDKQFYVTQPGSSVVTSLCEGEALEKHVAILKVHKQNFKLEPVRLKTVRPFVFDSVKFSDWNMKLYGNNPTEIIQEYVDKYIRSKLLEKAKDLKTDDPNQPTLPLIRLRIEFEEEYECFNAIRFGQTFTGIVANPTEMVMLKRKMGARATRKGNRPSDAPEPSIQDINIGMADLIDQYFEGMPEKSHMKVLSRIWLAEGMSRFIDKDEKDALDDLVYHEMKKARSYLEKENTEPDIVNECINRFHGMRLNRTQELEEVRRLLESDIRGQRDSKVPAQTITHRDILSDDDDDDFGPPVAQLNGSKSERGRGRGRGRGARGGRGASTAKGAKSSNSEKSAFNTTSSKSSLNLNVSRKSNRTSSSKSITSYLTRDGGDSEEMSQDTEDFSETNYKPSPKKKMKFMYVDDE